MSQSAVTSLGGGYILDVAVEEVKESVDGYILDGGYILSMAVEEVKEPVGGYILGYILGVGQAVEEVKEPVGGYILGDGYILTDRLARLATALRRHTVPPERVHALRHLDDAAGGPCECAERHEEEEGVEQREGDRA